MHTFVANIKKRRKQIIEIVGGGGSSNPWLKRFIFSEERAIVLARCENGVKQFIEFSFRSFLVFMFLI